MRILKKKAGVKGNPLTVDSMRGRPKLKKQIKAYLDYCENTRRMSPRTMDYKAWCFNEFVRGIKVRQLEDLTNRDIDAWIARMTKDGKGAVTINHCITQAVVMLKWHKDMGTDMPDVHISLIQKQKEPDTFGRQYYTNTEVARALSFADRREWIAISLCFDCGLRIEELCTIRLHQIRGRGINVIGKGRKLRFVMMSEDTRRKIDDYIASERIDDFLFPGRDRGRAISINQLRRSMMKPFCAAGLSDFHPHMLRHSFAMDLLNTHKLSVREIQKLLGHSKVETTEHYLADLSKTEQEELWLAQRFGEENASSNREPVENFTQNLAKNY